MTYPQAKKLHNGDEVTFKRTGRIMRVVEVDVDETHKDVFIRCDDGNVYHHTALK